MNVWLEPRATADIDVTVEASVETGRKLHDALARAGYRVAAELEAGSPAPIVGGLATSFLLELLV